ncbi:MAG: hypothetical protein PHE29_13700 [Tissierellia bacterium]|nr:hypothetical protein [Tissierellia bacterium]
MFIDKDGITYEHTYESADGCIIVHHHGTKELSADQNEKLSKVISIIWNELPVETQERIIKKMAQQNAG